MRPHIVGIELEDLVVILQSGIEISLGHIGIRAVVEDGAALGKPLERGVAVGKGLLEPAHRGVGHATVGGYLRRVGVDLGRLGEIGECGVVFLVPSSRRARLRHNESWSIGDGRGSFKAGLGDLANRAQIAP
jgi:hypothetical protein